jgi:hypothetical protein
LVYCITSWGQWTHSVTVINTFLIVFMFSIYLIIVGTLLRVSTAKLSIGLGVGEQKGMII